METNNIEAEAEKERMHHGTDWKRKILAQVSSPHVVVAYGLALALSNYITLLPPQHILQDDPSRGQ